ncbi:uncharacterized protein LOC122398163 [Colletes gigas]|uniref:uncharacterized protein LOC122398163 n=1 Tax=Colletes gigas TaxID=935657 RepID=UPI001C9B935A|nr:uncharacterized protein LOC122398163 [Colletes gigas]
MTLCCATNCPNRSFQKVMKRIPKDKELRAKWIHQINRPNFKFGPNHFICELHFAPTQWENRAARRLKKDAVPTIFCHCSKKRLHGKLFEKLIDDHRYSSSPLPATRVFSPARTVTELNHLCYDEKENQKYKNLKKIGRPSKGSGLEHEVGCPMKLRVIDHDYTMMLPIHTVRNGIIPITNKTETVSKESAIQKSNMENARVNASVKMPFNNSLIKESPNNTMAKLSFLTPEKSLTEHLSNNASMDFDPLDEHSVGTIEISCSTSDVEKCGRNDNITNKLRNEVIRLKREKAVFRVRLSRLQKKYDSLTKLLSGKFG